MYSNVINRYVTSRWIVSQIQSDFDSGMDIKDIINRLENNGYGFNHPVFASIKKRTQEQDDYISDPPDVVEGVVECYKCGSKKVYSFSVQTRAADEPMSTRAFCTNPKCKNKWTQNG